MKIDFGADRPHHRQLADILRADITAGRLKPAQQLPSQNRLMQQYGLGSVAVRQALAILRHEGLITTTRGEGSAVMVYDRKPYHVAPGADVEFRMPSPTERRELRDEAADETAMPEGVPIAVITPGPRKHRVMLRGDRWRLVFGDEGETGRPGA
ncbi:winged helix-turn-helix domain-containing protein [Streptosporangium sp. NPDC000563]|uniref:winged helix-turn-helix domain-containing protein n=1 Tax=Streptosporangium sp. NPDC000563 TaxID=3154366 RepID=UPI00332A3AED